MAMMAMAVNGAIGAARSLPSQSSSARIEQTKTKALLAIVQVDGRRRRRRSTAGGEAGGCMRLQAQPSNQQYVDYAGKESVFPAEACEELGGDSCAAEGVGPEVKLQPTTTTASPKQQAKKQPDREYVDYDGGKKTVFPGEACDDLGGEFCKSDYQKDVFPDKS